LISVQDTYLQGPGESALQLAASDDCRKVLKRAGAYGWTPLHNAAEEGDMESLTTLLINGVRLDELNGVKTIRIPPPPPLPPFSMIMVATLLTQRMQSGSTTHSRYSDH
jgi:hypothetical protein